MALEVLVRRFWFEAGDPIRFPEGRSANALRGGFGASLRAVAPPNIYTRLFEPTLDWRTAGGPSGFADPPRPFVFRIGHLDGRTIEKHDDFLFDVHLFGEPIGADYLTAAVEALFSKGIGIGRGKARLTAIADQAVSMDLTPAESATRARVRFETPTELKHGGRLWSTPDFSILIRRVRDRVSNLMALYGDGEPEWDFRTFGELAEQVRVLRTDVGTLEVQRKSGRTGQTHSIGGIIGEADYEGVLDPFIPFLRTAYFTGVGRHTVWGNGCIGTEILSPGQ